MCVTYVCVGHGKGPGLSYRVAPTKCPDRLPPVPVRGHPRTGAMWPLVRAMGIRLQAREHPRVGGVVSEKACPNCFLLDRSRRKRSLVLRLPTSDSEARRQCPTRSSSATRRKTKSRPRRSAQLSSAMASGAGSPRESVPSGCGLRRGHHRRHPREPVDGRSVLIPCQCFAHVRREVEAATRRSIALLPFRIEDVPLSRSLEYFLTTSQ